MKLQITVDKEVLRRSMFCGTLGHSGNISSNCAVAVALKDVFGEVRVGTDHIVFYEGSVKIGTTPLPAVATRFIHTFDDLMWAPQTRLSLPDLRFEIEVPEVVINSIGIGEITRLLEEAPQLKVVEEVLCV